jgi:hypothetical protein
VWRLLRWIVAAIVNAVIPKPDTMRETGAISRTMFKLSLSKSDGLTISVVLGRKGKNVARLSGKQQRIAETRRQSNADQRAGWSLSSGRNLAEETPRTGSRVSGGVSKSVPRKDIRRSMQDP